MRIHELVSKPALTCGPNDTLVNAAQIMWDHDCGVVPVIDENERLVGILTDRDLCMAAFTQGRPLHEIVVSAVMTTDVVTCHGDDTVETIAGLMIDNQVRRIPVLDAYHRILGILSINDLVRYAVGSQEEGGRLVVETLAAIGKPRTAPERRGRARSQSEGARPRLASQRTGKATKTRSHSTRAEASASSAP